METPGSKHATMNSVNDQDRIPGKEIVCFSSAIVGQNIMYGIQLSFLMFAFTDFLGISAAAAGALFLVAGFYYACIDPVMGIVADRTRTRWGKFRPWLLGIPIPLGIMNVLCFVNPGWGQTGNLIWAAAIYLVWGTFYSLTDIPLWSLSSVMSRNSAERTKLVTIARMVSLLGILVPTLALPALAHALSHDKPHGYLYSVMVFCAISIPLMTLAFFGTTERVAASPEKINIKQAVKVLTVNRPLQILVVLFVLNLFSMGMQSAMIYYAQNNLGSDTWFSALGLLNLLGMLVGMSLVPAFAKRYGKKKVVVATYVIRLLILVAYALIGYHNITLVLVFTFLNTFFMGPFIALSSAMLGDSIDWTEWKTGIRADAVTWSIQTFSAKIVAAVGAALVGTVLSVMGYKAGMHQTPQALYGIFSLMSWIPAFGTAISLIPIAFYSLDEKEHARIVAELEARHAG